MTSESRFEAQTSSQFRKDLKKAKSQGKDLESLRAVMSSLLNGHRLEVRHRDHALGGNWKGYRDCHITPDWLLIYRQGDTFVRFERLGSHSELFG